MSKNPVSLTKGVFFQLVGRITLELITFLSTRFFSQFLSTSDYGKIAVYGTWCSMLSILIGLQVSGSIGNARIYFKDEEMNDYLSSIMTLAMISFILFFVVLCIFAKPISVFINIRQDLVYLLIIQSFLSFCVGFYDAWLISYKYTDRSTILNLIVTVFGILLSLFWVYKLPQDKYIGKLYGMAIPIIIIGTIVCIRVLSLGHVFVNMRYWSFCLSLSLPLILHGLGSLILGQSDRVMLQKMLGEEEAGIYSLSCTMSLVMTAIFSCFNNVWVPYYYDDKKNEAYVSILQKSKSYYIEVTILFIGFLLLVPEVFIFITPESSWIIGLRVIPVLVMSEFFRFLYLFPANHEFYNRKTKYVSLGTAVTGLLNIVLNVFFIRAFSVIGAAVATCISSFFLFLIHLLIAKYVIRNFEYKMTFFLIGLIPFLFFFVFYYVFLYFFPGYWYIRWCFGLLLGIALIYKFLKNKSLF